MAASILFFLVFIKDKQKGHLCFVRLNQVYLIFSVWKKLKFGREDSDIIVCQNCFLNKLVLVWIYSVHIYE